MTFPKQRNELIDFEDLEINKWYAFTVNPIDKYQHFRSFNRSGECLKDLNSIFCHYKAYEIDLYPELSKKGRFHYHGIIKVMDKVWFYLSVIPHLLSVATISIKEIKDEAIWLEYCRKQHEFHDYITLNHFTPIPLEIGNNRENLKQNIQYD